MKLMLICRCGKSFATIDQLTEHIAFKIYRGQWGHGLKPE